MSATLPIRREARVSTPMPIPAPSVAHEVPPAALRVSVIIKALNEERHIAASIESALRAIRAVGGEVILADSGSSDRTVEIARGYPISIVQLKNTEERRCGIGPQLGYQHARGDFVYILDGDMELDVEFLPQALQLMDADTRLGGIGGVVEEDSEASYQFRGRKRRAKEAAPRNCEWLDMGGLYRRLALQDVEYFSNRNLHAYEEMELGLRLCAAGWTLRRIDARGVTHHGRPESTWPLLVRRWRSRYLDGAGELLRASVGRPYFYRAAQTQQHLFVGLALWAALIASLVLLPQSPWPLVAVLAAFGVLIAARTRRAGNLADAILGQVVWQVTSLAMLRGLFSRPRRPTDPVDYVVLSEPSRTRATKGHSSQPPL